MLLGLLFDQQRLFGPGDIGLRDLLHQDSPFIPEEVAPGVMG
jgi:hypothetical protein